MTLDIAEAARRPIAAYGALVVGAVAMGASPIFVRLADVGPYASAFWRAFLALPFLWAWMAIENGRAAPREGASWWPAILAGVFFAGDLFFWHLSIVKTTVANATFFATTAPIWVALGAWLVYSERVTLRTIAGLALCIGGGATLIGESYGFAPERLRGDFYGFVTAVFFGLYILALRAARKDWGPARLTFWSTAVTAACLALVVIGFDTVVLPRSVQGVAALVALAVVSQVAGQGLLAYALGSLPATFSAMVIFLEAVAAAALGWIVLGEAMGWLQALGGLLILFGIYVARPVRAPKQRASS